MIATGTDKIDATKIPTTDKWEDGNAESVKYITIGMKNCYGDNPILQAKIEMRPAQYAPLLKSLTQVGDPVPTAGKENENVYLKGEFDTSMINEDLCFVQNYEQEQTSILAEDGEVITWVPKKMTKDNFKQQEFFEITFKKDNNTVTNNKGGSAGLSTMDDPTFKLDNIWVDSMLSIKVRFGTGKTSQSINFYPLNEFGVVEDQNDDDTVEYRTYKNSNHPVSSNYECEVSKEESEDEESTK